MSYSYMHRHYSTMSVFKVKVQDICIVKLSTFLQVLFFLSCLLEIETQKRKKEEDALVS